MILRLFIAIISIVFPALLLKNGIYGSFLFTFSIPLLWQISISGKPINSLGLRFNSLKTATIIGIVSGLVIGFIGGKLLKFSGITGHIFSSASKLQWTIGHFNIVFPLNKELGYRLLTSSSSLSGLFIYLAFSIIFIGVGEELFWRGFIQSRVSLFFSNEVSVYITAVLFALIHFYIFAILPLKAGIIFLTLIFIAGVIWGYLFKRFNSIWPPALSHGISAFIIWKYYFFNF